MCSKIILSVSAGTVLCFLRCSDELGCGLPIEWQGKHRVASPRRVEPRATEPSSVRRLNPSWKNLDLGDWSPANSHYYHSSPMTFHNQALKLPNLTGGRHSVVGLVLHRGNIQSRRHLEAKFAKTWCMLWTVGVSMVGMVSTQFQFTQNPHIPPVPT